MGILYAKTLIFFITLITNQRHFLFRNIDNSSDLREGTIILFPPAILTYFHRRLNYCRIVFLSEIMFSSKVK